MPNRGESPNEAQARALKRGQTKRQEALKKGRERGDETQRERWARLLDGSLTVAELDDSEIARMRVHGRGGQFAGVAKPLPSHLAQQFKAEAIKRTQDQFRQAAPKAVKRLLEIAEDPDTKDADAIRALDLVLQRALGKVPDKVVVEGVGKFNEALGDATSVDIDRDLADLNDEAM